MGNGRVVPGYGRVASTAGYSCQLANRPSDLEGIDLTISGPELQDTLYPPRLELQVKSTSSDMGNDDPIRYSLKVKNYNELRKTRILIPKLLVVLFIPENPGDWLKQSERELCLRKCGYWLSLRGQPATDNTERMTVYLPRQQQFTVNALQTIMQQIQTRGTL
ncbi:MAG: DUF4365 domain-containing protein [Hormoscilla sp. SP5CHS1]|nr:DUF4365 domain-containing protein [Hormoscilla sp. SP12CHS1]MBC6454521.1 DUF4365 domain-containing protein [Hormoscilla sp. SP5CHS1]